jgi:hypothetical protein
MSKLAPGSPPADTRPLRSRMAEIVLVRIASEESTGRVIARDLRSLVDPGLPNALWRRELADNLTELSVRNLIVAERGLITATRGGRAAACAFLGVDDLAQRFWHPVRNGPLLVKALGLQEATPARRKALMRLDGLRCLIVETAWGLESQGRPSASRIRSQLAVLALERAFGNKIKAGVKGKTALSAKASRALAGQLAKVPRQHATDARLVAQLAAEAVGAKKADLEQLRQAALRKFIAADPAASARPAPAIASRPPRAVAVSEPARALAPPVPPVNQPPRMRLVTPVDARPHVPPVETARPDPVAFASAVKAAAELTAEGWEGNRKAFVSRVWGVIRERHAAWRLSEIEFKGMLAEAHRMGLIALANADLKDRRSMREIEASAVAYKNAVWHYVRLDT